MVETFLCSNLWECSQEVKLDLPLSTLFLCDAKCETLFLSCRLKENHISLILNIDNDNRLIGQRGENNKFINLKIKYNSAGVIVKEILRPMALAC